MRQPSNLETYYAYWRQALVDPVAARVAYNLAMARDGWHWDYWPPRCGFFRKKPNIRDVSWKREHGSQLIPVAIWLESPVDLSGELVEDEYFVALVGTEGRPIRDELALQAIFGMSMKFPVTEEAYRTFMETGAWPDQPRGSLF